MEKLLTEKVERICREQGYTENWQMDIVFADEMGMVDKLKTTKKELIYDNTEAGYGVSTIIHIMLSMADAYKTDLQSFGFLFERLIDKLQIYRRTDLTERVKATTSAILFVFHYLVRDGRCLENFKAQRGRVSFNERQRALMLDCKMDWEKERMWQRYEACRGVWKNV